MKLILLPGLDGTGILFEPLVRALPSHLSPVIIAYPTQETLGYVELVEYIKERIPKTEDFVIVAESFSGPLAIAVASGHPACLKGLVLSATFVSSPTLLPRQFSFIASSSVLALALQQLLVKHFLLGRDVPASLLQRFQEAVRSVPTHVLAYRMREVMNVDRRDALKECHVPLLYLVAKQDKLVKKRSMREMKAIKPGMEVAEIDGPHLLLQRQPKRCAQVIEGFIGRCV